MVVIFIVSLLVIHSPHDDNIHSHMMITLIAPHTVSHDVTIHSCMILDPLRGKIQSQNDWKFQVQTCPQNNSVYSSTMMI